jgi:hypothetical protein
VIIAINASDSVSYLFRGAAQGLLLGRSEMAVFMDEVYLGSFLVFTSR